jgi:hypothetical protein
MGNASSQMYDLRVSRAPLDPQRISKFAQAIASGIANGLEEVGGPWIASGDLVSLMSISAWMSRAGTDHSDSIDAMLLLRRALLTVAEIDLQSEPVPLLPADDKVAIVNLARYLEDLICRASRSDDCTPREICDRALDSLAA